MNIYPNPTNGEIFIGNNELYDLVLYDMQGREIIKLFGNSINLSQLSNGIYLVRIEKNNELGFRRIIKE